jgi:hypothetical protein
MKNTGPLELILINNPINGVNQERINIMTKRENTISKLLLR